LRIVLAHHSSVPIYEQIKEQIKASVLSRELSENDLLPSIRQLARDLKVSVMTTTRAYNDLEIEGYIVTVPGKGCYIRKVDDDFIKTKYLNETKTVLTLALKQGKRAGLTTKQLHQLLDEVDEIKKTKKIEKTTDEAKINETGEEYIGKRD